MPTWGAEDSGVAEGCRPKKLRFRVRGQGSASCD